MSSVYFSYSAYIFPFKWACPLIWSNLIPIKKLMQSLRAGRKTIINKINQSSKSFVGSWEDWLLDLSKKLHSYGEVTITGEVMQNLDLCWALIDQQEGVRYTSNLIWHGTSVLVVSSNGRPHSVALYVKTEELKIFSDPQRAARVEFIIKISIYYYLTFKWVSFFEQIWISCNNMMVRVKFVWYWPNGSLKKWIIKRAAMGASITGPQRWPL